MQLLSECAGSSGARVFLVISVQNLVFSYPEGVEKVCNKNTLAGNFDFCECLN